MADVFVSYAHGDSAIALGVVDALRRHGFVVWWDRLLPAGVRYRDAIREQIEQAACVLVIWSPRSYMSDAVVGEAALARRLKKLLPTSTSDFDLGRLPMEFEAYQTIPVSDEAVLVASVRRLVDGGRPSGDIRKRCNMQTFNAETGVLSDGIDKVDVRSGTRGAHEQDLWAIDVGGDGTADFVFADPSRRPHMHAGNFYRGDVVFGFGHHGEHRAQIISAVETSTLIVLVSSGHHGDAFDVEKLHGAVPLDGGQLLIAGSPAFSSPLPIRRSLWRMPKGSSFLVRSYGSGALVRLVSETTGLIPVAADGYEKVFDHVLRTADHRAGSSVVRAGMSRLPLAGDPDGRYTA